ncbi:hypothetical protein IEQ34_003300 [Dendrobium chrysotoxum]|uniref:VOC domain-containing protein n=1 Tax=Dendrobium chrysotoxum TaxID=161865 RepID=A0AAV7HHA2_DENCH|nr:hypothetical protein IEQ34_003300 [Dendrobium chrysotoxum]
MAAAFRWVLQLHRDVPKAARFYSEGLGFSVDVCTLRWAELQSGPLKLALMHSERSRRVTFVTHSAALRDSASPALRHSASPGVPQSALSASPGVPQCRSPRLRPKPLGPSAVVPLSASTASPALHVLTGSEFSFVYSNIAIQNGYSSMLSFTVTDIQSTVTKLVTLGAELDGPIKYEIHGKVAAMRCIDGHMLGLYEPA